MCISYVNNNEYKKAIQENTKTEAFIVFFKSNCEFSVLFFSSVYILHFEFLASLLTMINSLQQM